MILNIELKKSSVNVNLLQMDDDYDFYDGSFAHTLHTYSYYIYIYIYVHI